jgi:hypothetical protein
MLINPFAPPNCASVGEADEIVRARAATDLEDAMSDIVFFFQAFVAIFSMAAGGFWMAAAYGRTVGYSWQESRPVPLAGLMEHQMKRNGRAAACASMAAICQALSFVFDHYSLLFFPPH